MTIVILVGICSASWTGPMYHEWSQGFGDASDQTGYCVAVDGSGNVFVTGNFYGSVDFGGGILTSVGGDDIFVAKFDAIGNHIWSDSFGDANADRIQSTAVDGSGNVFVAGYFGGNVDFGGGPLISAGSGDIFVAKFDGAGGYLWSDRFGDASNEVGHGVAVDGYGNVYITGYFQGSVDFGGGTLTSADGNDIFIAKFDAAGTHLWSDSFGGANNDEGQSVAIDGSGNVIITGNFYDSVDFGGGPLTSAGSNDIFVAKFDAAGTHVWSEHFGDGSAEIGWSVAVDGSENAIVTGYFQGSVDFGGGLLTSAGSNDIFVAKFDTIGTHVWSEHFGDGSAEVGFSATVDGSGNVFVTGYFRGDVDFGGGTLTNAGDNDVFVVKFDPVGPICDIHPTSIDFGEVVPFTYRDTAFTINNIGVSGTLDGDVFESCSHYSIISGGGPFSLAAGESLVVDIRFEPTVLGTHVCTIETGDALCSDVDLTGVATYCTNVPLGVVSWWPLDQSAGTESEDIISGYTGTHDGDPIPIAGHVDTALMFDGSDDFVRIPDNPALNITTDITVELWFKLNGTGTYQLLTKGGGWTDRHDMPSSYVVEASGGNLVVGFEASNGANFLISTPRPTDGQWHHVAYTREGNLNKLYLDGVLARDSTATITPGSTAGIGLYLGTMYDYAGNYRYLNGALDELAIYNRALDPSEIMTIYATGAVGKCKDVLPFPRIEDIVDVPNDQGGWARIHFVRSMLDDADEDSLPIVNYGVQRRVDDLALIAQLVEKADQDHANSGSFDVSASESQDVSVRKRADVVRRLGDRCFRLIYGADPVAPPGVWEVLGTVPARQEDSYIYLAPTLADSSDTIPYSVYFIAAHTTTPSIYFDSAPDSGYSVDNIAPGVPEGLLVAYNTGSGNQLTWDPAPEPDFQYFKIYRDTDPGFTPGPANFVDATATTSWTDPEYDGWNMQYKIAAVDHAGNESGPASIGGATAVEDDVPIPKRFALHQNVPNPFNPTTLIRYDVPAAGGHVTLCIYDVAGRLVQTLVDRGQGPGVKTLYWNGTNERGQSVASGVYFYRMTTRGFEQTRKMILLR